MTESSSLFARAENVIPGGVNSPVRAFGSVGGNPIFVSSGSGCRMQTVDGAELIDFCGSWGPLILGHAHPEVCQAVESAMKNGMTFGISTEAEVLMAEKAPSMLSADFKKLSVTNNKTGASMLPRSSLDN